MTKPEAQFIITIKSWTPDTVSALESAAGEGSSVRLLGDDQIAVIHKDIWLGEEDLREYIRETGGSYKGLADIFDALMVFNDHAAQFSLSATTAVLEQIAFEREKAGVFPDRSLFEPRLRVNQGFRLVARSSLVALSSNTLELIYLERLGLSAPQIGLLAGWGISLAEQINEERMRVIEQARMRDSAELLID